MNWKYIIVNTASKIERAIIKSGIRAVSIHYPFGRHWLLDLKRTLKIEPKLIIDAGANVGDVAKELSHWFPLATVFAFEPVKNTFDILGKKTIKNPKIHNNQLALGANNETFELSLNPESTIN